MPSVTLRGSSLVSAQQPTELNPAKCVVFVLDDQTITVGDVLHAADFRGELQPLWRETRMRLQCQSRASELGLEPDEDMLQARSDELRYDRDLITAEETERWLEQRGLTLEEFNDYCVRCYWADALDEAERPDTADPQPATAEGRELLRVDLILSGRFDLLARDLSWRMAAARACGDGEPCSAEAMEAERARFSQRAGLTEAGLPQWLGQRGRDGAWLDGMLRLEAGYRRLCESLLTAQRRERALQALRLPLTRFEIETIECDSQDAAREAALCVRVDGLAMAEAAREGGFAFRRTEALLEDVAEEWQQEFLSAPPGEVLEPVACGEVFRLVRVVRKVEPSLNDPAVSERIGRRVIESYFAELCSKHVRWLIVPGGMNDRST